MSEVDVVTVSSRGQISIPSNIRKDLNLEKGTKLLIASKNDNIILKKIDPEVINKSLDEILNPMQKKAEKAGIKEEDTEKIVQDHRNNK